LCQKIKDIVILVFNKEKCREKVNWLIYGNKDRRLDKLFIPHSPVRSGGIKEELHLKWKFGLDASRYGKRILLL
jgi:hypothetical protein